MISEEFKIRISRTHIRTLILVNYYSCYMSQGSENSLCEGFDVFLRESSYHFLNVLSYVLAVLNKEISIDFLKTNEFYKCVDEYAIDTSHDDLILERIKELCAVEISSQEDINAKVRNIFLQTIANENIIDLFKIKEVMFLYDNILQQLGRNIGNEYLFTFLCDIKKQFHRERDFYVDICRELYHEFDNTCRQVLSDVKNWRLERIYILDKIIICIAFIEERIYNTPKPVLINEYVELAKGFSTAKSGSFVNGILDNIIKIKS